MTQSIANKKRCIALLPVLIILLLTTARSEAQQCGWSVNAAATPSTCEANGTVTATLVNAGSITGTVLYRLASLTGSFEVPQTPDNEFVNIPAGQYKVVATGVCSGHADSVSTTITVGGSYVQFTANAFGSRSTLENCNTGRITCTLTNGKPPYTIHIGSKPAGYTGPVTFVTSDPSFVIDDLPAGSYTVTMNDDCSGGVTSTIAMNALPPLTIDNFDWDSLAPAGAGCNQFTAGKPYWLSTSDDYNSQGTPISYSISYNGGNPLPYKPVYSTLDTVILPAGQTLKDAYGKVLTYYLRTSCGQNTQENVTIATPTLVTSPITNCDVDFSLTFGLSTRLLCYPLHFTVKNNSTSFTRDTTGSIRFWNVKGLPYGSYTVTVTTADGFTLQNANWTIDPPPLASYSVTPISVTGPWGMHRAANFSFNSTGQFVEGTRIDLLSPVQYQFSVNTYGGTSQYWLTQGYAGTVLRPDTYLFRVSDGCVTNDLQITITEDDVYNYSFNIPEPVQSCEGLKITPQGTAMYQGISQPVWFRIINGEPGSDYNPQPEGTPLTLPAVGGYKIGIAASGQIDDWDENTQGYLYTFNPVAIDVNRSMGWVCPNLPADSGYIRAFATGGSNYSTGVYTFKLAAAGNGGTGPYLAINTTGEFSTSASGGTYTLTKNKNYDIQVVDECGGSAVQTLKIIDFATAQIATANQAEYCLGDTIRFSVINLPSTAITYQWTGPDNFSDNQRNPVVGPVTEKKGGVYHVTISADICKQPINADVNIVLASYITSCYSALTDTSVNPYAYGLLGAWRPVRSYTYYGARAESDPSQPTNIRKDGAFNDFMAFWQKQTDGWKPQTTDQNWVWNAQTTLFNKKGFELENKDPLGRYNAGIYGYDNAVPVAVIQNSRYRESTFDGFEDYAFVSSNCDDGKCPVNRRFNLSGATTRIVNTEYHTGRYSLKVTSADKDSIAIMMPVTETATDPSDPSFDLADNNCPPYDHVLKSVRADSSVLLPPISLLWGKKVVVSAWVKEAQDCKCTSYTNSQLKIVVKGADASGSAIYPATGTGAIIDGWQRIEQVVDLPAGTEALSLILLATGSADVYFDDIRVHPYNANMKSFVYDAQNLRLMAELDENNYATF